MSSSPVEYIDDSKARYSPEEAKLWGYEGPGWYFYDETWAYIHGPYLTQAAAGEALTKYARLLERGPALANAAPPPEAGTE